jgi:hypothetical protein
MRRERQREREREALNGDIQTTIAQHPRKQNTKQKYLIPDKAKCPVFLVTLLLPSFSVSLSPRVLRVWEFALIWFTSPKALHQPFCLQALALSLSLYSQKVKLKTKIGKIKFFFGDFQ